MCLKSQIGAECRCGLCLREESMRGSVARVRNRKWCKVSALLAFGDESWRGSVGRVSNRNCFGIRTLFAVLKR